jgi:hypothetical protein
LAEQHAASLTGHGGCGNCGVALTGPYCAQCGQHAHESARDMHALFHDAWHSATHIDGRFWQTLYTLLLRPGVLTREYFLEHRARFIPPVRVYLVLSVLFFSFGNLVPHAKISAIRELPQSAATPPPKTAHADDDDDDSGVESGFETFDWSHCDAVHSSWPWLSGVIRRGCVRNAPTRGQQLQNDFLSNIPKMMFVFVPLIAVVMLLLYWRPRRLYVEHVVFFLHNHAAMFLILLVETVLAAIVRATGVRHVGGWVVALTILYMIWYAYRAMRRYYGQGRWKTVFKFLVVGCAYVVALTCTVFATLILSATVG